MSGNEKRWEFMHFDPVESICLCECRVQSPWHHGIWKVSLTRFLSTETNMHLDPSRKMEGGESPNDARGAA